MLQLEGGVILVLELLLKLRALPGVKLSEILSLSTELGELGLEHDVSIRGGRNGGNRGGIFNNDSGGRGNQGMCGGNNGGM